METSDLPVLSQKKEVLFDVSETCYELLDSKRFIQELRNKLETALQIKKKRVEDLIVKSKCRIDEIVIQTENVKKLRGKKSDLSDKLLSMQLAMDEIKMKRKMLKDDAQPEISQDELMDMQKSVLLMERENELKLDELKKMKKMLIGKMCFYKEYLDLYLDAPCESHYTLYFRRCKGLDDYRPKEWITIHTDNFIEYDVADISLPNGSRERQDFFELCDSGIPLKQLIYDTRKLCLRIN